MDKLLPKEFIDLQIFFATKVSEIKNMPLEKALFIFTSLPVRFGIPFSELTEDHLVWKEYLKSGSPYEFYLKQQKDPTLKQAQFRDRSRFGCFSYNLLPTEKGVLLHFSNNDAPEPGSLSDERIKVRLQELKDMFTDIKLKYPDIEFATSSSWLHNVNAFVRLFPPAFISSKQIKTDYHSMGIWGQFLNKYGDIKEDLVKQFTENVTKSATPEDLENSFPLKNLKLVAPIQFFFEMYKI